LSKHGSKASEPRKRKVRRIRQLKNSFDAIEEERDRVYKKEIKPSILSNFAKKNFNARGKTIESLNVSQRVKMNREVSMVSISFNVHSSNFHREIFS